MSANGIAKIRGTDQKFDHGVGFSNGCAAIALKIPPPFVPICLIASWLATGPIAIVCVAPLEGGHLDARPKVLDDFPAAP